FVSQLIPECLKCSRKTSGSPAGILQNLGQSSPACRRAAGMANAGPIPITSGGTPTTALPRRTPSTGRPRASTADLRPSSTAAAPSLTWLELPGTQMGVSSS
ncbi:hypothetical protein XENOCAPTIV_019063, partial [Xenoophorus captivus]